ncbi:MAG: PA2778 family cysteine peptidase [Gammaproteobacteria bacterium]|nr:PA2778 family cysteine peptidase [Gammaproteobacteria bacterium]
MYSHLSDQLTNNSPQSSLRALLRLGAFLLVGILCACTTPRQTLELRQNPPNIPLSHELVDTPFFPQTENHCGPAALASILQHYNIGVEPDDIAGKVYTPGLAGSLQFEMVAATRIYELLPVRHDGRLESLLREINAGNPVLVMQNLGLDSIPFWHYAVVVGYDLEQQSLILRSGTEKRLVRPFDNFERTWQRTDYWGLVIVPPYKIPASATPEAYLNSVIALEQTGHLKSANLAYQTALSRWPESIVAHMGQGNTAYALMRYNESAAAYQQLLKLSPDTAEAWNNLAYALARQGDKQASLEAINKAIQLSPDNANFQQSLVELRQLLGVQ